MSRWKTFEEAVAEVHRSGSMPLSLELEAGRIPVPSPPWDTRPFAASLVGRRPSIVVLDREHGWVTADITPPVEAAAKLQEETSVSELVLGPRNILFMDVSGWSKLTMPQIRDYVALALPKLEKLLVGRELVNTWGDAIVATFLGAKEAAEAALRVRDHFHQGYPHEGVPSGTLCRIALHHAEVIVGTNPVTGKLDVFGHGVHVAARLEPVTPAGQVFCTSDFAHRLEDIKGFAPKTWPHDEIELAKGFGPRQVLVVTWPNEPEPPKRAPPQKSMPVQATPPQQSPATKPIDCAKAIVFNLLPDDDPIVLAADSHTKIVIRLSVVNCSAAEIVVNNVHLQWVLGDADGVAIARGHVNPTPVKVRLEPGEKYIYRLEIRADRLGGSLPQFMRFGISGDYVATGETWREGVREQISAFVWGPTVDRRKQPATSDAD